MIYGRYSIENTGTMQFDRFLDTIENWQVIVCFSFFLRITQVFFLLVLSGRLRFNSTFLEVPL